MPACDFVDYVPCSRTGVGASHAWSAEVVIRISSCSIVMSEMSLKWLDNVQGRVGAILKMLTPSFCRQRMSTKVGGRHIPANRHGSAFHLALAFRDVV